MHLASTTPSNSSSQVRAPSCMRVMSFLMYTSSGTSLKIVGTTDLSGGYLTITLDGESTVFNRYSPAGYDQACNTVILSRTGLSAGHHQLTVDHGSNLAGNSADQIVEWQYLQYARSDTPETHACRLTLTTAGTRPLRTWAGEGRARVMGLLSEVVSEAALLPFSSQSAFGTTVPSESGSRDNRLILMVTSQAISDTWKPTRVATAGACFRRTLQPTCSGLPALWTRNRLLVAFQWVK